MKRGCGAVGVLALLVGIGRISHQDADRGVDIGQAALRT
jgi:hypothetical protein